MKDFHCRDFGLNCDWVARGSDEREILDQAGRHAQQSHNMKMTPEVEVKVRGLIHDESSDAHRASVAQSS